MAEKEKRIFLLTGDLGFSVFETFRDKFPDRFINMGVAEQNMIGVAAGLALCGKIVFVYSIVPFVTLRCLEQVRNDLCYQNLNVRLIGSGGGVTYGTAGATHYGLEDIAIMRSLVNMTVVVPGDRTETELVIRKSISTKGPIYIRIGRSFGDVHSSLTKIEFGKGIIVKDGKDIALIATGSMLFLAKKIAEELSRKKISVCFVSMPTIKPIDVNLIKKLVKKTKAIFTIEEHSIIGGLGSAISEIIAETNQKILFKRYGFHDRYMKLVGSQEYLLRKNGLMPEQIVSDILLYLMKKGNKNVY
ncbi:MAG: 1-deoxy-D-xylulose-5-phosphate synthase [Candidatus Omnitrophica bacterium]|nr:1-deoxy-D-xylulose-5-phosphate synthase [Candidatus Omnitrophota bacterium]